MSSLILPRRLREGREVVGPRKQRGFIINPYAFATGGGGGTDPYIAFRKTIANLNVDLSDPYRTWTAHGDAAVTGGALVLDGTGDYLSTPNSTDFDFGSGDFCLEAFIEISAYPPAEDVILAKWGGSNYSWFFGIDSSWRVVIYYYDTTFQIQGGTNAVPLGAITHVAAYRVGFQFYVAIGGVPENVTTSSNPINTVSLPTMIGAQSDGASNLFAGEMNGVRVTKGSSGGYGATSFTPPSFPLPTS